jgi:hypothetical protein
VRTIIALCFVVLLALTVWSYGVYSIKAQLPTTPVNQTTNAPPVGGGPFSHAISWVESQVVAVIVGVLTVFVCFLLQWSYRLWQTRSFRKIAGANDSIKVYYGELALRLAIGDIVNDPHNTYPHVEASLSRKELWSSPLVKPGEHGWMEEGFGPDKIACVCEVRASAYVAGRFSEAHYKPSIMPDTRAVGPSHHTDSFVSFGYLNNIMSKRVIERLGWIDYEKTTRQFVVKVNGQLFPLHEPEQGGAKESFGVIVRANPKDSSGSVNIVCAGVRSYGTAGAAYYLAEHWEKIASKLETFDDAFVCVIRVNRDEDDTAELVYFARTADELYKMSIESGHSRADVRKKLIPPD